MRSLLAVVAGAAAVGACAVVLGDYPLSGSIPWLAAAVVPLLIGSAMSLSVGAPHRNLWIATGPLAGISMAWGVRIATGYGLDPVPASCWAALGIAVVWPPAWGAWRFRERGGPGRPSSVDGELGDLGHAGRAEVRDP